MESGVIVESGASPTRKIITIASIAAGVQFGWALQLSLLTPYSQTLGVPHTWSSFIWLCGPISGLLVQPIVGYHSDRCKSKFGRRRPFITAGAVCVAIAVFLVGFAKDLGYKAGDSLDKPTKPRAVAMFVVGFWILDVANNMLQGPCRALLADLSAGDHTRMRIANGWFSFFMAVGNVLGYAAGSYSSLYKIFPFTKTLACDVYCANLKSCFIIDIIFLLMVTTMAITTVSEKPFMDDDQVEEVKSSPFFGEMISSFKSLQKPMWILLLVTSINWTAWFPFVLFDTDWMGTEVFGGKVTGNPVEVKMYDRGVRSGSLGLMINSIVLAFASLALEPLGKLLGGVKNLWGVVNIILGLGLASTVWITKVSEAWRASQPTLLPPPSKVEIPALAVFGVLGIPLAVTYSIPFALASIFCSTSNGGQGLSLGLLNMSIVIPQMIVSVVSGPLDGAFGGGNVPAFVLGAVAAIVSAVMAMLLLPKPSKEVSLSGVAAGH